MTRRLDPDVIADRLRAIGDELLTDGRTISLGFKLDELRHEIGRALVEIEPVRRRPIVDLELAAQAAAQGAGGFGPITSRRPAL